MTNWKRLSAIAFLLAAAALGQAKAPPVPRKPLPATSQSQPPAPAAQASRVERGQQVFLQNCSRCHAYPEGFPASIAATIAMHMRVRANLSEQDFKALLRFLKP